MAGEQSKWDRAEADLGDGVLPGADGGEVRATVAPDDAGDRPAPQHPLGPPTTLTMSASQHVSGTERVTVASLRENMRCRG